MKVEVKNLANPRMVLRSLREREQVVALMRADPQLIARAWVTACKLEGAGRDEAVEMLKRIFVSLPLETIVCFCRDVICGDQTYGGTWPDAFLKSIDVEMLIMVGKGLERVAALGEETRAVAEVAAIFLESGSPVWDDLVSRFLTRGDGASMRVASITVADTVGNMLGPCLHWNRVVIPHARETGESGAKLAGDIAARFDIPTLAELEAGATLYDAKGRWMFMGGPPVRWLVSEKHLRTAAQIATIAVASIRVPKIVRELCLEAAEKEGEIEAEIMRLWNEILAAADPETGVENFHWPNASGIVLYPTLCGLDRDTTGVVSFQVIPQRFPAVRIFGQFQIYFGIVYVEAQIDPETGLMVSNCAEEANGEESGLQLILNLEVIRILHAHVFAPRWGGNGHSNGSSSSKTGGNVHKHFPRLPAKHRKDGSPYHASEEAIARSLEHMGYPPPPGRTFAMSPPIRAGRGSGLPKPRTVEVDISSV